LPHVYDGRNRTFFSTSFEKDGDKRDLFRQARVPTELERKGDFSQTRNRTGGVLTIYDPFSTVVVGSKATRTAFAGNVIPADRISPTGAAVLNALPLPNIAGPAQIAGLNWSSDKTYSVGQQQESFRV